jgi:hypothetical protein
VREKSIIKISENKEINDIKQILGLELGKNYETNEDILGPVCPVKPLFPV